MDLRKLYKATAVMGVSTFVAMVTGLLRAKFLAVQLGPEGVGIFSQALIFFQSIETISAMGIGLGVTNYVAEASGERCPDKIGGIISSSCVVQMAVSAICFMSIVVFQRQISQAIFASQRYALLLVTSSAGVLFTPVLITLESAMLGVGHADRFSASRIIYYIAGLFLVMALVGGFGLNGGFIFIAVNAMMSLATAIAVFMFTPLSGTGEKPSIDMFKVIPKELNLYFKKVFSYGSLMLTTSAITWFSVLAIRSKIIGTEGAAGNGLYQVAFAIVGYYTPFFTNGVWGHLFPKLSSTKDASVFNDEVNMAMRFIILFVTPALAILFLLRRELVVLIFSREFLGCLELFPLYLFGSFFFLMAYVIFTTFLAGRQLKSYFLLSAGQSLSYIAVFYLLVRHMGLLAIAVSYFAVNILTCLVGAVYQRYRIGLKFDLRVIRLFILSTVFISVELLLPAESAFFLFMKWVFVVMWLFFVIGKNEGKLILSYVRQR